MLKRLIINCKIGILLTLNLYLSSWTDQLLSANPTSCAGQTCSNSVSCCSGYECNTANNTCQLITPSDLTPANLNAWLALNNPDQFGILMTFAVAANLAANSLPANADKLQSQLADANAQLDQLNAQLTAATSQAAAQADLTNRINTAQTNLTTLQSQLSTAQANLAAAQAQLAAQNSSNTGNQTTKSAGA